MDNFIMDILPPEFRNLIQMNSKLEDYVGFLKKYDPIHIKDKTIFDIGYYLKIKKLHVEGFSNIVTKVCCDPGLPRSTLTFEVRLPKISGSIESFESNAPIIYGNGNARFIVKNMKIKVTITYDLLEGLVPTQVFTSMNKANVVITGLNDNEELSVTVSKTICKFLKNLFSSVDTRETIGQHIDCIINSFLK